MQVKIHRPKAGAVSCLGADVRQAGRSNGNELRKAAPDLGRRGAQQ
jgi:hypothetical protein